MSTEGEKIFGRPPDGDTDPTFNVSMARILLENVEKEPHTQAISDSLFVELRLACDLIEKLMPLANKFAWTEDIDAAHDMSVLILEAQ